MATHDLRAKIERVKNRIEWLDVVRGIALCGIAFANIGTVWKVSAPRSLSYDFMQLLVQQRFFPIFSLLFGIGFGLMWSKNYGRVPLLRRFLFIGALGALHQFVHPGEALLFYAAAALFILLPSTYMPRAWVLAFGVIATVLASPFGGPLLIPGLFLLGSGLAQYGIPAVLAEKPRIPAYALIVFIPIALITGWMQWQNKINAGFSTESAIAGLAIAAIWICLAILLMHTPARSFLQTAFAPMGRLALTNYIGATLIMLAASTLITLPNSSEAWDIAFLFVAGMLVFQIVLSWVWDRTLGQGPLERLWRMVTWWSFTPTRSDNREPSNRESSAAVENAHDAPQTVLQN
ncbi:hypothetical protein VH13_05405 [Corynebacterium ulcerans]|uniref:DUF418 domain-containing protein n=1 Tax=Corynebacterium ulcerans TaxID=65058 RepID=UPI00062845A1|nr:hypothetical protein VH13_05405 [Corynebacterium ulcerans]KKO87281.1 hypothetical protein VH15_06040 [Corynebacterium ulcerans]KPJ23662.1 hypothetical protein AOT31_08920 [Corynebacterium ulcerans]BDV26549.1 hypothetical protein CULTSU28_17970 [Corynebacterium ulcerans]